MTQLIFNQITLADKHSFSYVILILLPQFARIKQKWQNKTISGHRILPEVPMLIKKLYFVFYLIIHIQLLSLHTFAMLSHDPESDGLCGITAKAILTPELGTDLLYQSSIFKAQMCPLADYSIEYHILPLQEDLQNWEYWHPAHWMQLFQIARAIEDFSEKIDAAHNTGFQLSGYQYIDEETDMKKIKFILAHSDSHDFSTSMMTRNFNSKRVTSPITGNSFEHHERHMYLSFISRIKSQYNAISKLKHRVLKIKEFLPAPLYCRACNHATEEAASKSQSEKPFWRHIQSESDPYDDLLHTQHICSLHHCTDVMTLELSETLSSLIRRRTTKESPENFDVHIRSYSITTDKHLTCRLVSKTLDSWDSRKTSTDTEFSYDSFIDQPPEKHKPFVKQGKLKKIEITAPIVSAQSVVVESVPPPPSKKGQLLRKRLNAAKDAAQGNAWTDDVI
jgi:hypothetical protein